MKSNHEDPAGRELNEAQLTAYALGQLDAKERAAIEAKLARSEKARRDVEETSALAGHLNEANRQYLSPQPSAALCEAIDDHLTELEVAKMETRPTPSSVAKSSKSRRPLIAVAAVACLVIAVVALALPSLLDRQEMAARQPAPEEQSAASGAEDAEKKSSEPVGFRRQDEFSPDAPLGDPTPDASEMTQEWAEYGDEKDEDMRGQKRPRGEATRRPATRGSIMPGLDNTGPADIAADPFDSEPAEESAPFDNPAEEPAPEPAAPGEPAMIPQPVMAMPSVEEPAPMDGPPPARLAGNMGRAMAGGPGPGPGNGPGSGPGGGLALNPVLGPVPDRQGLKARIEPGKTGQELGNRLSEAEGERSSELKRSESGTHETAQDPKKTETRPLRPNDEEYEKIIEKDFSLAERQPLSTFSVDVDSASYANVRRFLSRGQLPPAAAVRIEEMVNYFPYDYAPPTGEEPFAVDMEVAGCPWNANHRLVQIGIKGKEISREERGASNLVFLIDTSGSMRDDNKLPLVKQAMAMLVGQLTEDDRVAIVTYASSTGVQLEPTCGNETEKILTAIDELRSGGSTHGSAGIQLAYEQAAKHFVKGGVNRVILATDGDLNVGITDDDQLVELIKEKAATGVFLTVLGVGTGNLKDSKLEKLADKGNGAYAYLDDEREAHRVMVEEMSGSLITIAKDVKLQVEFNPAEVYGYRLIGYENRMLAARDFDDDKKDAGEIGAGHTVTAIYEILPARAAGLAGPNGQPLKYGPKPAVAADDEAANEMLTLSLRYKDPEADESKLLQFVVRDEGKQYGEASEDFRFASAVAAFGMMLRGSPHCGDLTLSAVEELASGAVGDDLRGYRTELVEMVRRARQLRP